MTVTTNLSIYDGTVVSNPSNRPDSELQEITPGQSGALPSIAMMSL